MTAPQQVIPAKGTQLQQLLSLATTPAERARAWEVAERIKQDRIVAELMDQAKALQWGNKVSAVLRANIIRWALAIGADPMTECDVLGGNPYLNARYWQRLTAADPTFQRAEERWVHDDPRASAEEREIRKQLRVQYAIPDAIPATAGLFREQRAAADGKPPIPVTAAVIVSLFFKDRGPFIGRKWCPSRASDDVGIDNPELTAFTRAWRRAAIQGIRRENPFSTKLKQLIAEHQTAEPANTGDMGAVALPAQEPVEIEPVEPGAEPAAGGEQQQ